MMLAILISPSQTFYSSIGSMFVRVTRLSQDLLVRTFKCSVVALNDCGVTLLSPSLSFVLKLNSLSSP